MCAFLLFKLGWLLFCSRALAALGDSRNDGILGAIVESANIQPFPDLYPSGGHLSVEGGRIDRGPPSDRNQQYLVQTSQGISAMGANVRSSTQREHEDPRPSRDSSSSAQEGIMLRSAQNPQYLFHPLHELSVPAIETDTNPSTKVGKQKGIRPGEKLIGNAEKRQKIQELDPSDSWRSNFHPGNPFDYEPGEWLANRPYIETYWPLLRSEPFDNQAEFFPHQSPKPPTTKESRSSLSRTLVQDVPHFPGTTGIASADQATFPMKMKSIPASSAKHLLIPSKKHSNASPSLKSTRLDTLDAASSYQSPVALPPTPASNLAASTNGLAGSRSAHSEIYSPSQPSSLKTFDAPRGVHPSNQSPGRINALGPVSNSQEINPPITRVSSEAFNHRSYNERIFDESHLHSHLPNDDDNHYFTTDVHKDSSDQQDERPYSKEKLMAEQTYTPIDMIEAQLVKYAYPRASMTEAYLSSFTAKLKRELDAHFNRYRITNKSYDNFRMDDFPAMMLPIFTKLHLFVIRPLDNPALNNEKRKDSLNSVFKKLIRWLIFINTAVTRHTRGGAIHKDESAANAALIDWLVEETFRPAGDSFPIFGPITVPVLPQPGKAFGEVQQVLLQFLSVGELSAESFLRTCTDIIRIWNKKVNPKLATLFLPHGREINSYIKLIVWNAVRSKIKIGNFDENSGKPLFKLIQRIGNFELADLDLYFPTALQPKSFNLRAVTLGKHENLIMDAWLESRRGAPRSMEKKMVGNLPVKLASYSSKDSYLPTEFFVSVTYPKGKSIEEKHMMMKLQFLFYHLRLCHRYLLDYLKKDGPINNAQEEFLTWLTKNILEPEDSYPIFGKILRMRTSETYDPKNFGDLQIYIISYFSELNSQVMIWQLSLGLIGYWYKLRAENYFISKFTTDKRYWANLIEYVVRAKKSNLAEGVA
ncbi:hypothetical protein MJO28_011030 [Puccinia striiformis f. sp. tritici]|uniref:Uncharacterized protein n=1 Tax=Puccinia striiformis f. sp. tritici TaxID=168172 RepID=A0ACC0E1G4_9BASI|nr:hypothetical protein Pst134EA_020745 [Puccinia striiformis f. sp. tritici]KAH9456833.1 hypothetical protein Pst134EA_020745 [Puccinia striiformis f. sp. tritici]KAI7943502.1 hypothetical protein MJO28_011030 [Puccinia striiformis f. sp. tritici]